EKRALLADLLRKKAAKARTFPLSFAQQRLWFLDQFDSGSSLYNISRALRLRGTLDVAVLQQAVNALVARHESLRTNFDSVDGEAVQVISPSRELEISVTDLTDISDSEREPEARRLATIESRRPFHLAQDNLLRVSLLKLDEQDHLLLLITHHIISDGWSQSVLVRELSTLYEAFSNNLPSPLAELSIQYADLAQWQRRRLQGEVLAEQVDYWRRQLAGAPNVLELPTDRPRPVIQTFNGAHYSMDLPKGLCDSLRELSLREGATS